MPRVFTAARTDLSDLTVVCQQRGRRENDERSKPPPQNPGLHLWNTGVGEVKEGIYPRDMRDKASTAAPFTFQLGQLLRHASGALEYIRDVCKQLTLRMVLQLKSVIVKNQEFIPPIDQAKDGGTKAALRPQPEIMPGVSDNTGSRPSEAAHSRASELISAH
ncbi:hypothetical protein AAFF_G00141510 [Aldrovandia affinis]|uniref:Uncharacterized protein n=1 Tax=Aldrovandia affinis TaxID=143900 RepID=A0AAD7TCJ2_9TELE|nr:hypothetical protein AAFF_G00141510 [Aldrovandia affinis]